MIENERLSGTYSRTFSIGSSYVENFREQKRLRAGSVSGRLRYRKFKKCVMAASHCVKRAASDLQERGFIDKSQKGILKDFIISGNPLIQNALDKFSGGDPSELEGPYIRV